MRHITPGDLFFNEGGGCEVWDLTAETTLWHWLKKDVWELDTFIFNKGEYVHIEHKLSLPKMKEILNKFNLWWGHDFPST